MKGEIKIKQKFITPEVAKKINLKEYKLEKAIVLSKDFRENFKKTTNKEEPVQIYDLGFNKTQKIIPVLNHINKTGTNPLREDKTQKIKFYDITNIYQKQEGAKITECLGNKFPEKNKKGQTLSRFLCNYAIVAHYRGIKKIFAYIID